jgi:hypothetical protein
MVTRAVPVLAALLLAGCPDDIRPKAAVSVEVGLRTPTDLAGAPDGGSLMRLTWADRATSETGYRVEANLGPFESSVVAGLEFLPANATSHATATTPNTTYYFRVFAITDTLESAPSNVLVVTTPPAAPGDVVAYSYNSHQLALTWQDVAGESGYVIERSTSLETSWVEVGTLSADVTEYLTERLAPDSMYYHRVVATGDHGRSSPSEPVGARTTMDRVSFSTLPTAANNGLFNSFVVPHPGVLHIAHYDAESTSVTYSSRIGTLDLWATSTADGGASGLEDVGGDGTSLAVEGELLKPKAHIVAHDRTNNVLRYATNGSGSWVRTTLDGGGAKPKIAQDPAGTLHVAYQGSAISGEVLLRMARKVPGQAWTFRSFVGLPLKTSTVHSLTLDGSGRPHVLLVGANGFLVHAYENAVGGLGGEQLLDPAAHGIPDFTALVIEPGGTIHAFYRDSQSKSLHHLSRAPGAPEWLASVVDDEPGGDLGSFCSAFFDPVSNWLLVAYTDARRGYLKCASLPPGESWTPHIIDAASNVGSHVAMASIWGGTLYFAYRDETRKRLKLAVKQF